MTWRGAFSTLGCARSPLDEVVALAVRGDWNGLELRAAPGEPVHIGLTSGERVEVRRTLEAAGLAALSVASYVEVDDPRIADADLIENLIAHVQLAEEIGASFVRVFPGGPSGDDASVRRLTEIARRLDEYPEVSVGLETHDSCARGRCLAEVLERVDHPRVRAIWDLQHPWLAGEPIEETADALAPHIGYVQISDVRAVDDPTPCVPGTGAIPLRLAYDSLRRIGYAGWVSLEWPSFWYPSAPPLAEALAGARAWIDGVL